MTNMRSDMAKSTPASMPITLPSGIEPHARKQIRKNRMIHDTHAAFPMNLLMKYCWPLPVILVVRVVNVTPSGFV